MTIYLQNKELKNKIYFHNIFLKHDLTETLCNANTFV